VEDLAGGDRFEIEAGTLYALDQHDRHVLRADSDMVMACVFNPPLTGREIHDENGVYPLPVEAAS
jgi:L-ectoine synthase